MPKKPGGNEIGSEVRTETSAEITEPAALKALAQPRRQQILQHLTLQGPATSAILARALDLNTGATSYHLRELARFGFVTDAVPPESDVRRARWWRAVPGDRRFPSPSRRTSELRIVMAELNRHAYATDLALFERLQRESEEASDGGGTEEWADGHAYSRGELRLTLPGLRAFFDEYIALMNRYKRPGAETPPGARTVRTRLLAFPGPGPAQAPTPGDPAGTQVATAPAAANNPATAPAPDPGATAPTTTETDDAS